MHDDGLLRAAVPEIKLDASAWAGDRYQSHIDSDVNYGYSPTAGEQRLPINLHRALASNLVSNQIGVVG